MLVAPAPTATAPMPAFAAFAPRVTVLAPVNARVRMLWACAKLASLSVVGVVRSIVSEPPLPKIAAEAASAASEANAKTSAPRVPSNQAGEALLLPAGSVSVAKKSRTALLFSCVRNDHAPVELAVAVPSFVAPS